MKKRTLAPLLTPTERTIANIADRFYPHWTSDYVFHPERLCWVVPVSREKNFVKWTWFEDNGEPFVTYLDQIDLAIVVAYHQAQRNLEMYAYWKEATEAGGDVLAALAGNPLTAPVRFLYDEHTKPRHDELRKEMLILQEEYKGARERALFPIPDLIESPPRPTRPYVRPAAFRRAAEAWKAARAASPRRPCALTSTAARDSAQHVADRVV